MAVEGESEQSFVTWLQRISETDLRIHLDTFVIGGGGYKTMLENAIYEHQRRIEKSGEYENRFLIVDADRARVGDWSIAQLKRKTEKAGFNLFVQRPNHEGLLLRLIPGMEQENTDAISAKSKLKNRWETYHKPANAYALSRQFSLEDLLRAANFDVDLRGLLEKIGLV